MKRMRWRIPNGILVLYLVVVAGSLVGLAVGAIDKACG